MGDHDEYITPCFCPAMVIVPCFLSYEVHVTAEQLQFSYGPLLKGMSRVTIKLEDIDSVKTGSSTAGESLLQFGGWGIRYGGSGEDANTTFYNPINGPWVQVKTSAGKKYRFSTREPEKVEKLLQPKQGGL